MNPKQLVRLSNIIEIYEFFFVHALKVKTTLVVLITPYLSIDNTLK